MLYSRPMGRAFILLDSFAIGIFALLPIASTYAQQSEQGAQQGKKPDTPIIESFPVPARGVPQTEVTSVPAFAARLVQLLDGVDCRKQDCTILVAEFVSPKGFTSPFGRSLADELSAEFALQRRSLRVLDRASLAGP